jgi:uncharacterized protein (DUF2236 family)
MTISDTAEIWGARLTRRLGADSGRPDLDFRQPAGEAALVPADSVSWRVFKNPVALFIGGINAVLLELAEPRVRSGVWDHSSFRGNPVPRMKRTGVAALITVYGARSVAEAMIAHVRRMHGHVTGITAGGTGYRANDPELLDWVQATASFGFLEAYCAFVTPLPPVERDRFYAEGALSAALYGATGAPQSVAAQQVQFARMRPKLEASPVIAEFLAILRDAPILPRLLRVMQGLLIRAAIDILPADIRALLGLDENVLKPWERGLVHVMAMTAERLRIPGTPPSQACQRLGLPANYLYR